ncbi:MAG: hypothetical protein ABSB22_17465, partial [Thermodesulfobacteriota bacterium]
AGGPWPKGWIKLPYTVIDKSNIDAYITAWNGGMEGLREFYRKDIDRMRDMKIPNNLPPADDYNHPPKN